MKNYAEKQEARRERLLERAEKAREESSRRYEASREALAHIPFGQPILVGHHSERAHRAALRRSDNAMRASIEADAKATHYERAAEAVGTAGISSDDPDAPAKIREKIAELERRQALMVAVNKVVRAFWKGGYRAEQSDEELARYFEKIAEAGVADWTKARGLLRGDYLGRMGFADYEVKNNNANIRRLRGRLAELERKAGGETKEYELAGVRVVENVEENRLQLFFPGKPDVETRTALKSAGFRWSPMAGAWQRQLNNAARAAATYVLERRG